MISTPRLRCWLRRPSMRHFRTKLCPPPHEHTTEKTEIVLCSLRACIRRQTSRTKLRVEVVFGLSSAASGLSNSREKRRKTVRGNEQSPIVGEVRTTKRPHTPVQACKIPRRVSRHQALLRATALRRHPPFKQSLKKDESHAVQERQPAPCSAVQSISSKNESSPPFRLLVVLPRSSCRSNDIQRATVYTDL